LNPIAPIPVSGGLFRPKAVDGSALAGIKRLRALSNSFDPSNNGTPDNKTSAARELFSHLGHSIDKPPSEALDAE
jgi:hypothetical protein